MTVCAVRGCHNRTDKHKKDSNITFHTFPTDPIDAARWTKYLRLNRKEVWWKPTKCNRVCSVHFKEKDKYVTKKGYVRIRKGAFPTKALHICCNEHEDDSDLQEQNQLFVETSYSEPIEYVDTCSTDQSSKSEQLNDTGNENTEQALQASTNLVREVQTGNENTKQALQASTNLTSDDDLDYVFDSPLVVSLRGKLRKKEILQCKLYRKLKTVLQKNRRQQKRIVKLKNILQELRKKKCSCGSKVLTNIQQ